PAAFLGASATPSRARSTRSPSDSLPASLASTSRTHTTAGHAFSIFTFPFSSPSAFSPLCVTVCPHSPEREKLMSASPAQPKVATPPSPANIQLLQLTTACWTSRCLHVIADLGVADALGDHPQSTEALSKATGTQPQALFRVLRLLASVGIFEW